MKWLLRILFTLMLFATASVLGYVYVEYTLNAPPRTEPVEVEIEPGDSLVDIGETLEKNRLIRDDLFFAAYAYMKGKAKGLQPGLYEIPPGTDVNGILRILTDAKQSFRVTVPEGYTVEQIADKLAEQGVDRKRFLQAVNRKAYDYSFVRQIPDKPGRRYLLEGYLFPMTYNLSKERDPEKLVDKMLHQFERELKKDDVESKLRVRGLTVDEWVTIASIIEREGQVRDELPRIAGVIYNRLKANRKLQVDATVQYALGEQKQRLLYKDLKVRSPYNTYLYKGLPPGPIASPGKAALKAALEPEQHRYFFYVTRKDGSGRHFFAVTEAEHQRNIEKSKMEAAKSGRP